MSSHPFGSIALATCLCSATVQFASIASVFAATMDPATSSHSSRMPARSAKQVAEIDNLITAGNPALAPLKWSGILLNETERSGRKGWVKCTAQFISPRVLVTAAHCVEDDETGQFYDLRKMKFLLQYQNQTFTDVYIPTCASRFDEWHKNKDSQLTRLQWDYALIQVDHDSITGHYSWNVDWGKKYTNATATGYPGAMLEGQIIQTADGSLLKIQDIPNELGLKHNVIDLTQGSSGGAWVANFSKEEKPDMNILIGLNSMVSSQWPGISFGPYLTADFKNLFEYVSKGCPQEQTK